jgi:hypothetical protein
MIMNDFIVGHYIIQSWYVGVETGSAGFSAKLVHHNWSIFRAGPEKLSGYLLELSTTYLELKQLLTFVRNRLLKTTVRYSGHENYLKTTDPHAFRAFRVHHKHTKFHFLSLHETT